MVDRYISYMACDEIVYLRMPCEKDLYGDDVQDDLFLRKNERSTDQLDPANFCVHYLISLTGIMYVNSGEMNLRWRMARYRCKQKI